MRALWDFLIALLAVVLVTFTGWTGNAGFAVILLTIVIRIVLHPLNRWSLRSMKKIQALTPQMEVIRRKHKDNPQQMNAEIMRLYRSSGANPLGGCLPMLLQFPVLIALFQVFRQSPVFKGQLFFGIPLDLAPCQGALPLNTACFKALVQSPELALLPILVGVTTYLQQRLTITDPQQARMFVFMPILLVIFSFSFPAALSLYWVASTLVYVGEYVLVAGLPVRPAPALNPGGRAGSGGNRKRTRGSAEDDD